MNNLGTAVAAKWRGYPENHRFAVERVVVRRGAPDDFEEFFSPIGSILSAAGWSYDDLCELDGAEDAVMRGAREAAKAIDVPVALIRLIEARNQARDGTLVDAGEPALYEILENPAAVFGLNGAAVLDFLALLDRLPPGALTFSEEWQPDRAYVDAIKADCRDQGMLSWLREAVLETDYGFIPQGPGAAAAFLQIEAAAYEAALGEFLTQGASTVATRDLLTRFKNADPAVQKKAAEEKAQKRQSALKMFI